MIPLRDENPTRRVPVVTVVLIVLNIGIYFGLQPQGQQLLGRVDTDMADPNAADREATRFNFEYAAIPCEVTTGEPLSHDELPSASGEGTCSRDEGRPGSERPIFPDKQVWLAVVFSMFFHGSLLHLGGNMLFLWVFGNNIEDHLGPVRYLLFYLVAGIVATGAHVVVQPDSTIPLVGASGAVAGIMGAYLVWFPNAPVLTVLFFFIVLFREISAKWLLGFWFISQFFVNPNAGVAWMAHVGGFVFGALVGLLVRSSGAARQLAWRDRYLQPTSPDPWDQGRRRPGRW
ncbi:MAG: rhomboid family intramembrane serine protease [Actinobacteria bacterium]|nr:rhomboid family intramembrane serine protease [Actinomycetota bacterium]